jgi:hypothetical protein
MTVVLCRHCGRVMTEVPSGWLCECNGRIQLWPHIANSEADKRRAERERDARLRAAEKRIRSADWNVIQKAMGMRELEA